MAVLEEEDVDLAKDYRKDNPKLFLYLEFVCAIAQRNVLMFHLKQYRTRKFFFELTYY